ncbi:transmembrane protein 256 precursor [Danio rerio]|uniref:Transmembrane protein 256 n=1 Tax=Danio rerio TaxID=7955 RepID=TM256_DANRE|nr:transmembrane protein 256 precursor [Danio rerio]Q568J8.1 RecName: Full=Transmembrane protein 256; Flags: Precursor [Danio rerio]AAH92829.1 Zgc:110256 [Danio rerio]|eukprot:NP_001017620.1 transmembrane protein 256 precursor [Danio rerio]
MNAASLVQRVAGISGALAVAAGAYGAHGFRRSEASDYQRELFDTANKYHFYHSLALLGAARCRKPALAGVILLTGMGCFCGPLYHQPLTNDPSFSKLAPIGGSLLIVGWAAMAL